MDTRFWGPSGWRLLHTAAHQYDPETASQMRRFLKTLPFILPCKFCRSSLFTYYDELPPTDATVSTQSTLFRWLYDIHNKVNAKLRAQGLNPTSDPSITAVRKFYDSWMKLSTPQDRLQTFWDFLFSVAYCHPISTKSTPIHGGNLRRSRSHTVRLTSKSRRQDAREMDISNANWFNTFNPKIRFKYYKQFWNLLPVAFESSISNAWNKALATNPLTPSTRSSTTAWLWRMRCAVQPSYTAPYATCCKKVAAYSSDCGSKRRAITCRRRK
jgi:hypothetical protein